MVNAELHKGAQTTGQNHQKVKPVWVPATGSFKTRVKKARHYLKYRAWAPTDPAEGGIAVFIAVCNLRRYHSLWAATTLALIREHYNPRCLAKDGSSWALSDAEILEAYRLAGKRGRFPTLGVADPKAKALAARKELYRQLRRFWKRHIRSEGTCSPAELRAAFIRFRGGEDLSLDRFTKAVAKVIGARTVRPFGSSRFYRGFHLKEAQGGSGKTTTASAAA